MNTAKFKDLCMQSCNPEYFSEHVKTAFEVKHVNVIDVKKLKQRFSAQRFISV